MLFYDSGVKVKKLEVVNPTQVRVTLDIAKDCWLGEHIVAMRTRSGVSDYRSFFVGALPGVDETEPNNDFDKPQQINENVCVAGALQNEDADYYRIHAKKGQRLSVEIEGIRLGQAYFDPFVSILDKNRFELASVDDTVLAKQDGSSLWSYLRTANTQFLSARHRIAALTTATIACTLATSRAQLWPIRPAANAANN